MAASGYSITSVNTIAAGATNDNIIENKPGVKLAQESKIEMYLTREAVGMNVQVTVGGTNIFPAGPVNVVAANDTLPSTQDDNVITTFANAQDEILIAATNASAAPLQVRALIKVLPIDDVLLRSAIKLRRGDT